MPRKKIIKTHEPISGALHLLGALGSIAALVLLIINAVIHGNARHVTTVSIFGASLILLYVSSTIYHLPKLTPIIKSRLKIIDHSMIFILIAGTYTPICLIALRGGWGWSFFGIVWALALAGIIIKALKLNIPHWVSTTIYIAMGWVAVIGIWPLVHSMPPAAFGWLLGGGLFYTTGTIFYSLDMTKPRRSHFSYHEIWHLFVLGGSFSHFWLMLKYVVYL